ncbi:MAG: hypothetical protein ACXQTA_01135 [Candidatus Syntropharchaeales archaeon]
MPTREEIMLFIRQVFERWIRSTDDIWVAFYRLLLDYAHGVPRITDSNRLRKGIWRERALKIERALAEAIGCHLSEVEDNFNFLMRSLYPPGTQRMNPIGIAFACAILYLVQRFGSERYEWKIEARIGVEVFQSLRGLRRRSVDIVAFHQGDPFAVISSKWGIRHDRVRDLQEEADVYKKEIPSLVFLVVTNEFDRARLQKVLTYPTIDGVFHVRRDLVWQAYDPIPDSLSGLRDFTELLSAFS